MNTHPDILPQVVLMCGISGSGKTHFSKILEKHGYIRLSLDVEMFRRYGEGYMHLPHEKQFELQQQMDSEVLAKMCELIDAGKKVVVDQCFCKRFKRDLYRDAATSRGSDVGIVYCSADYEELLRRLSERNNHPGPDSALVTPEMLSEFMQGFQIPDDTENILDVSFLKDWK